MVFSDITNKNGAIQQLEFRTGLGDTTISGNSTLLKQVTALINNWYLKATKIIITADGKWQWDDSNQTDEASATSSLVSGQRNYTILKAAPDTNQDWLEVERVEIKDSASGNWITLLPTNAKNIAGSIEERFETDGIPKYFDFDGSSVNLYPATNYDSTGGIKFWLNRAPLLFTSSDTTKRPGFASIFHEYLVIGPQYDIIKDITKNGDTEKIKRDIKEMEQAIADFYGRRDQYEIPVLSRQKINYR